MDIEPYEFIPVSIPNGEWQKLIEDWSRQLEPYYENIDDYMTASLPVLEDLAKEPKRSDRGVFGLKNNDGYDAICKINVTYLPGYTGKVMRVRHITYAPCIDFWDPETEGELLEYYGTILVKMFIGALRLREQAMPADHLKVHYRSPAERMFFDKIAHAFHEVPTGIAVKQWGAWVYFSWQTEEKT